MGEERIYKMAKRGLSTDLIHSGDGQTRERQMRSVSTPETFPIYLTSAFAFDDVPSLDAVYARTADGYIYSRMANPNADSVARVIASADEGERALVFSSGMAAIVTAIMAFVGSGDHIISSNVLYGGVRDYMKNELARFGVETTFIDIERDDPAPHVKRGTKLIYAETISNPLMGVPDIRALSASAHSLGLLLLIDNTFASPVIVRPLELGADIALYSATKYLSGHADITAGAAVANAALIEAIKRRQTLYGSVLSPSDCWLLARSLRTLELRMRRHSENAAKVARFLEGHPSVEKVFYPGLESSASHERAKRQFRDGLYGGMMSFDLRGGEREASDAIEALKMIPFVPSLAGIATTVSYAVKTSHRSYEAAELKKLGITPAQLRLSVGLEDPDDIIADLSGALDRIAAN
jgi:methionine-gamma-lyase